MRRHLFRVILLLGLLGVVSCSPSAGSSATGTAAPAAVGTTEAGTTSATGTAEPEATGTVVAGTTTPDYGRSLTVMTHDSFSASDDVIAEWEQANKANLRFLKSGDAGAVLNRAILSKENPLADVLFGVDNTFFSRAIEAGIFEPYQAEGLDKIASDLRLDPEGRLTPIDFGFVNFNYDKAAFGEGKAALPGTLRDLVKPEYKGRVVVPSPATSSPGLAFLLTTVAAFGENGDYPWTRFWADLQANDVQIVDGWETAYFTNFSGSSGKGAQPIVLSYATSPAAEAFSEAGDLVEPPTANLMLPGGAFRQIEFAGILKGTENVELAQSWIDYMIGERFQADIPLQMYVYPARTDAPLPEAFERYAAVPPEPATLAPDEIARNRERWIQEWTRIVQQ